MKAAVKIKQSIAKGKNAVVSKNGKIIFAKKATKALLIEGADNYTIEEKTSAKLTENDKKKLR
jgi:hypothetical protein